MKRAHDNTVVWLLAAVLMLTGMLAIGGGATTVLAGPPAIGSDGGKHSCIQEVDGYAYLSEERTLSETRSAAFANAKRQAVEMARTYIESRTKVENFVLEFDEVTAASGGSVTVLEQKDLGVEDNKRYHVWIRAEVTYGVSIKPDGNKKKAEGTSVSGHAVAAGAPLTVTVWTPKQHYIAGEKIEIFVQGNRDFYARIVDLTSSGEIIQLLPNDYRQANKFKGGVVYKIPGEGDRFDLTVSPPFGHDRIVVYASEVPLGKVNTEKMGNGLRKYAGDAGSLAAKTRGISVVAARKKAAAGAGSGVAFYEGNWNITTGP
jgi:hypothetical protein